MKKNALLFIFLSVCINAQINRFFYEYKYIPDINNKKEVKDEMMLLDVDSKGSMYYSHKKFVSDSIMIASIKKQIGGGRVSIENKRNIGDINYKVTKSYPDFNTYFFTQISSDQYKIKEDQKPEWKILTEKQKIGEYNAQKATTSFGGRDWIAWFSTEIPIQDGPYKFYGLPGLIVKLEDTTGSHIMTLVGNKKIATLVTENLELPGNIKVMGLGGKELEISKTQYQKLWKEYMNDPTKNMREMMMRNRGDNIRSSFMLKTNDGKEITDPNQVLREMEKRTKESFAKNNNPIEPDLTK
ncbi:GLPGLI family protein [uncultured Chryseobacterium sp.]|uniref:GLPGLI family protein n=1 Tax=uncultured Chryseobacterium sp. TaxID=259322 RepID=UPI00258E260F|nr:GLPGLI family protein [uncultured Chryseobacterium sp.]